MADREVLELSTDFVAPTNEVEIRLADLYSRVFSVDRVGIDDDFFELGGDSFTAATLSSGLACEFGFEIKPSRFVEISTIRMMAELIGDARGGKEQSLPGNLSAVNAAGTKPPLFMIHGGGGTVFLWREFLDGLSDDQPVYLIQALGYDGATEPLDNIPDMVSGYLRAILDVSPSGPWNFVAFCGGGWIAVELVRQMELEGLKPANVILLDPLVPKTIRDDYRDRWIARLVGVPAIARAFSLLSDEAIALVSRLNFYLRTGVLFDPRSAEAIAVPDVLEAMTELDHRTQIRKRRRWLEKSGGADGSRPSAKQPVQIDPGKGPARARVMVKHAIRHYRPAATEQPFTIVGSRKLKRAMQDPDHPINRLLPNHTFTVSGERHIDSVANSRSAAVIQEIIGGAAAQ